MEEHFKNKLKNHRVDWDKEALLGNLKQELARDKSKFNRRWLFLLPFLFLATCWGVNQLELSKGESIVQQNLARNEIEDSGAGHKKVAQFDPNRKDIKTKGNSLNNLDKKQKEESKEIRDESVISTPNQSLPANEATIFQKNKNSNLINEVTRIQNLSSINAQTKNGSNNEFFSQKNDLTKIEERNQILIAILPFLKMEVVSNGKGESEIPKEQKLDFVKINPIKRTADFKNSFFASGTTDFGMVFRRTNLMNDNSEQNLLFKSKEKTLSASAFRIGYQHQSGLSLGSGFEYTQIREFLSADIFIGNDTFETIDKNGSFFFDQNLDTIFVDSMTVIETTTRKIRHNNKHTFLSIPLQVSFRKTIGRTDLFGTVGVSYAFSQNYNGREIISAEDGNNSIIDDFEFSFKNRIGVHLGVGGEYPIYHRTRGFVNLNYRRSPTLLFFDNNEQFYHSCSLGVGVRYSIGLK